MSRQAGWWLHVTPSLPMTEQMVEVDGLELYYRTGRGGLPLLLLHGGTVVGQLWDPFVDALGEHYTVIVPDLSGHGHSPSFPWEGLAFGPIARIMLGLVETLGLDGYNVSRRAAPVLPREAGGIGECVRTTGYPYVRLPYLQIDQPELLADLVRSTVGGDPVSLAVAQDCQPIKIG